MSSLLASIIGDIKILSNKSATIVQRLWNYCNVLRDDEIEKELDGALVRAERLRGSVFPQHSVCGMMKSVFEGRLV